jgi:predicted metal-dependent hydrolase
MILSREVLELPQGPTSVQWRRSARARRVSLRIDPRSASVVVTLPARVARSAGLALLIDHAAWVADRLSALPSVVVFAEGAMVPVAGVLHLIRHMPGGQGGAWLEAGEIHVSGDRAFLARRVGDLLRIEARRRLAAMVAVKCANAGVTAARVVVKDTRSRWGSCTPDRTLMFCWRLVMAPILVQDYVVAHEVAHLRHMNHGPRFWVAVAELTPHTDAAVAWLKREGVGLLRTGA